MHSKRALIFTIPCQLHENLDNRALPDFEIFFTKRNKFIVNAIEIVIFLRNEIGFFEKLISLHKTPILSKIGKHGKFAVEFGRNKSSSKPFSRKKNQNSGKSVRIVVEN